MCDDGHIIVAQRCSCKHRLAPYHMHSCTICTALQTTSRTSYHPSPSPLPPRPTLSLFWISLDSTISRFAACRRCSRSWAARRARSASSSARSRSSSASSSSFAAAAASCCALSSS